MTNINKILFFYILFAIIPSIICTLSFTYPNSVPLSDGNILIIHKLGITVCNSNLSEIITNVTNFTNDEILTLDSLSRITIAVSYENGYIFSIINDKIYIFDSYGNPKYQSENSILSDEDPSYYTLALMKIENGSYYYIIGFAYDNELYFLRYEFDIQNNENNMLQYYKNTFTNSNIINNGLSCQYMIDKSQGEFLVCAYIIFFEDYYSLQFQYYNIDNEIKENWNCDNWQLVFENTTIIKSSINNNHTKALFCFNLYNANTKCIMYDMEKAEGKRYYIHEYKSIECDNKYYGYKVNYYIENSNDDYFLFSCIHKSGNIIFAFLDMSIAFTEEYKYSDCDNIGGYSIVYLPIKDNYYIISDAICNNQKKFPLESLYEGEHPKRTLNTNNDSLSECLLSYNQLDTENDDLNETIVENLVKNYIEEFDDTNNHMIIYHTNISSIILYKNLNCSSELKLNISEKFEEHYEKVQMAYKIEDLIIVVITKDSVGENHPIIEYSMYDPIIGEKLDYEGICYCTNEDFLNGMCTTCKLNVEQIEEIYVQILDDVLYDNYNGEEIVMVGSNIIYQITNSENQNNNEYNNVTSIDLGECENSLRGVNNMPDDISLIIYKIDYFIDELLIPITEYEIFNPINLERFDLIDCEEIKINISIPVEIDENILYKYNPYSQYYKDKCYPSFSEYRGDNTLIERIKVFNENHLSLCEKNCEFKEYDTDRKKVKCECQIKYDFNLPSELLSKKNDLLYYLDYDFSFNLNDKICTDGININNLTEQYEKNEDILFSLKNDLLEGNLNKFVETLIQNEKKDIIINSNNNSTNNKVIYQLTSTYNQNNNIYDNISNIYLGDLENKLRKFYNIDDNTTLLILKMDIFEEGLLIPIIEYEIYNSKTMEKLDINNCEECKDSRIEINIPVKIDENNTFKYNSSSEYYNDMCYSYTTEDNTDIILKDRRNEFIENNMSLCEKNCEYKRYDFNSKKAVCDCSVKNNIPLLSEIVIDKDKLLTNFKDIKSIMNLDVMKCYKVLFDKKGLKNNLGNYIISLIITVIIILCLLFRIKGYYTFKKNIKDIIEKKTEEKKNVKNINIDIKSIKVKKGKKSKNRNKKKSRTNKKKHILGTTGEKIDNTKLELKDDKINNNNLEDKINNKNKIDEILTNRNIKINYNDYEFNNLGYKDSIKLDKRTYTQYYISLLKTKHSLINLFISDYNPKIIKIILFLFSFSLHFNVNALFFTDESLHNIYVEKGKFNINYEIPKILYSLVISAAIMFIIKFFSLTEQVISQLKKAKKEEIEESSKLFFNFIIKFLVFFILIFLFMILFWLYLSSFCAIYINSQNHLIKDTLISFGLSMIYPLGLNLIPGLFRIPALNKHNEILFKISKIIQLIS